MKTKLFLSAIALSIVGWCHAANYLTLTLYSDGCESANVIKCNVGRQIKVSAIPENEHRHFVRWSDGNIDNPRLVTVTKDTTLTAEFADDPILTLVSSDDSRGRVYGGGQFKPNSFCKISATAEYGYHFTQWSDGNTDNPRTIVLTCDTTFTAEFAYNQYTISTEVNDAERGSVSGGTTADYLSEVTLTATANYGYHFARWTDWNTDNPRMVQVLGDATYSAVFEKNTYTITAQSANDIQGYVYARSQAEYLDQVSLTANPNLGYHFTQWSDGNTDNPRTIVLTCDTTFTAEFAYNQYTISTEVNDAERGSVSGGTTADYLSEVTLTATANYGYHFARWTDWNTDNPRMVQVLGDATYSAVFEKNTYTITAQSANDIQGYVYARSQAEYLDQVSLTANPNLGYHFTQWSDGNTDNPRTIVLTCDTTFTAEFAQTFSGQCGENLYWRYQNTELTISGTGAMDNYKDTVPWILFRNSIKSVVVGHGATSIGQNAFANIPKLAKVMIGNAVENIGTGAFANCRRLYDIYCYSTYPPFAEENSFANYNVYLYVPCEEQRGYQLDVVWGKFQHIQCIGAENTTTDGTVMVTPSDNEAVFVWRADESAATYNLEIRKDGKVFCTLIFNANGQLTSIAFAPARNGQTHRAAEQTAAGFRFTVTGLSESTRYTFGMTVKDATNATLQTYTGEFNTTSVATSLDNATTDTVAQKIIRDGQVLILRGDKTYTPMGVEVNL